MNFNAIFSERFGFFVSAKWKIKEQEEKEDDYLYCIFHRRFTLDS